MSVGSASDAAASGAIAAIGVDAGGTNVRVCAIGADGLALTEVARSSWRDVGDTGSVHAGEHDSDVARLANAIGALTMELTGQTPDALGVPIGVGIAAQLSADSRWVLNAPNIGWRSLPLADRLEDALGVARGMVVLGNDVNVIAQGEASAGAARGSQLVLAVFWGTGIGGALVVGGEVLTGAGGNTGEIGHVKIPGVEALCGCGERGCLESVAGGASLLRLSAVEVPALSAGEDPAHPGVIDAAVAAGDPAASALWDRTAEHVGTVIANACTLLNPDRVVLGGGVWEGCPELRRRVREVIMRRTLEVCRRDLSLVDGELGELSGVLGAAALARRVHKSASTEAEH
ncbi:MAG: glucokinase [Bradymonadia bacterium]